MPKIPQSEPEITVALPRLLVLALVAPPGTAPVPPENRIICSLPDSYRVVRPGPLGHAEIGITQIYTPVRDAAPHQGKERDGGKWGPCPKVRGSNPLPD